MTKALALDQSTGRTGWTFGSSKIDLGRWQSGHFRAPKRDEEGERLIIIHDSLLSLMAEYRPDLVVYETPYDPTFDVLEALKAGKEPRSNYSRTTMNLLQGVKAAVTMAAARHSIPTESYTPRSWQATLQLPSSKHIVFSGLETEAQKIATRRKWLKGQVIRRVTALGAKIANNDEADSWGLCFHALHGAPGAVRSQMDLLDRVEL